MGEGWAAEQEIAEATRRTTVAGYSRGGRKKSAGKDGGGDASAAAGRRVASAQANGGARGCAMRALQAFTSEAAADLGVLPTAIVRVWGGVILLAEVANGQHGCKEASLQKQASVLLTTLGL